MEFRQARQGTVIAPLTQYTITTECLANLSVGGRVEIFIDLKRKVCPDTVQVNGGQHHRGQIVGKRGYGDASSDLSRIDAQTIADHFWPRSPVQNSLDLLLVLIAKMRVGGASPSRLYQFHRPRWRRRVKGRIESGLE